MDRFTLLKAAVITLAILNSSAGATAQSPAGWKEGFKNPPEAARPRTWWHWTQSNVTKEGITKDLEWMKRVGIAGFQLADVAAGNGQTVSQKLVFGTPEWKDALRHTAAEADRLGLEMAIFSSPGWSLTGGPWVKPEQAMKKLVWSELKIDGPTTFDGLLPPPPRQTGAGPNLSATASNTATGFYADCAVIAYRTPADETAADNETPLISSSGGAVDGTVLTDDNLSTVYTVHASGTPPVAWIQFQYKQPLLARAVTLAGSRGIPFGRVLAGDDGIHFHTLATIPGKSGYRGGNIRTYAFPETRVRYYRIEFTNAPVRPADVISQATTVADSVYLVSEIKLVSGGRVNRWEDKAGFNFLFEYSGVSTPDVPAGAEIDTTDIIDLTSDMQPGGALRWKAPEGHWTIMRFGYALTGAKNRPAVPAALGYEVDKLSRKHVETYMQYYTGLLSDALGPFYGKRMQYIMMDSWEAGIQNWTDDMIAEFTKRRGYNPRIFLPVLAGRIVGSAETSDRFLWDFRRTLVDMFAENHYGTVTEFLHRQGIKTYGEAGGVSLESMEDALLNKKYMDIPMGEFWIKDLHPAPMYYEDVRGAASSAHVYGKNLVAAEAFTGGNFESPGTLKKTGDYWFTQGINRLVFHTSAHQPLDTKPGNTMVGTHLNRNITWAEQAAPLITHFSRISFMLQKGVYIADIAYLLPEGAPSTMPFWGSGLQPAKPEGYEFDYINTDVLLNRMSVDAAGKLVLPGGMRYSVLVLPPITDMSVPVLEKLQALVKAGATIVGPKPLRTPNLAAWPLADSHIISPANEIWGGPGDTSRHTHSYGKGRVYWDTPLKDVLTAIKTPKDITIDRPYKEIAWTHRRDGDIDIYYLVNRTDTIQDLRIAFRVAGKDPELWNPDSGSTSPAAYTLDGRFTKLPLHLERGQAIFVVFHGKAMAKARTLPVKKYTRLAVVDGHWQLYFPPHMGAPDSVGLTALASWTGMDTAGIKYFSGTAVYRNTFHVEKSWLKPGAKIWLDMGRVGDLAEVWVNGKRMDLAWAVPFRVDISSGLVSGSNLLEIKVTNEWTNRLIGDKAMPDKKVLDAYITPFGGPYRLTESGLMGPVQLLSEN